MFVTKTHICPNNTKRKYVHEPGFTIFTNLLLDFISLILYIYIYIYNLLVPIILFLMKQKRLLNKTILLITLYILLVNNLIV